MAANEVEIDDSLYSRQRYVLGDGAMQKLAKATVLIIGVGGVGVEVAKNVMLAGVKSLVLFDKSICKLKDLGTQFFITEDDVKKKLKRDEACCARLAELNPYVSVDVLHENIFENLSALNQYQCVVVTEKLFSAQIDMNNYCRSQTPSIPYISSDVHGLFSYIFCDFGDKFHVFDKDGEEGKEILIKSITKANPCVVTTLEYCRHDLESGDLVTFKEIKGMSELNNNTYEVTYLNPFSFSINLDSTSNEYPPHDYGGLFKKVKKSTIINFVSLAEQLLEPNLLINDLSKFDSPIQNLLALNALQELLQSAKTVSLNNLNVYAENLNGRMKNKVDKIDENILNSLCRTYCGKLSPLCAAVGGIVAQEVLKSVTGKFTPLNQWLLLDAIELTPSSSLPEQSVKNDRYQCVKICLNDNLVKKIFDSKLFMVGCGAIGCEMIKNFCLLGTAMGDGGSISITDHDLIEKSNLNRQFLFRPWHIQKPKSTTAAMVAKTINPDINMKALNFKVSPETETVFTDEFFMQQDIIVNALDNVTARKYIDGRCVSNMKPLVETGTMGPKGHVQIIVPHMTESYSNQQDPIDNDVPYCTLKSFPQSIEHTIQWARDKFEDLFTLKPTNYNKFWKEYIGPENLLKRIDLDNAPDGVIEAVLLLQQKPTTWACCIQLARNKFESYFNHKALQLLHAFPLDTKLQDGSLFWQPPKRPPAPIIFSEKDATHLQFVVSFARLFAASHCVLYTQEDLCSDNVLSIIRSTDVKPFRPSSKVIVTDENKTAASPQPMDKEDDKFKNCLQYLKTYRKPFNQVEYMNDIHFEKDDDSNGHIDFITASSNLRATMYNIETVDRFKTKLIAGRIIPAIATTTAAIAGLATIELLKVLANQSIDKLKNCFLNLALPVMILSEPGAPPKTRINECIEFTSWDRWDVQGHKEYKLKDFIQYFKEKYNLTVSMVCEGVRMVYVPIMPGHKKRLDNLMVKLLKPSKDKQYSDLVISFESTNQNQSDDDDVPSPPVRYFYNL